MSVLARLLNVFYRTKVPCFPVVEMSNDRLPVQWSILGWITRNKLDPWMSDLERMSQPFAKIPNSLLVDVITPDLRKALTNVEELPVLDIMGTQVATYNAEDIHFILKRYDTSHLDKPGVADEMPDENGDAQQNEATAVTLTQQKSRMSSVILGSVPVAMYAADLAGNTLFYNREFEKNVLSKKKLTDSIRVAEKYFRELSIQILSNAYGSGEKNNSRIYDAALDCEICMINLVQEQKITGYLFMIEKVDKGDVIHIWEKRLEQNHDLQTILDDIESRLIHTSLSKNDFNISHAAKYMGLKRTTLQTKMKRLKIIDRFDIHKKLPTPETTKKTQKRAKKNSSKTNKKSVKPKAVKKTAPVASRKKAPKKSIKKASSKKKGPKKSP